MYTLRIRFPSTRRCAARSSAAQRGLFENDARPVDRNLIRSAYSKPNSSFFMIDSDIVIRYHWNKSMGVCLVRSAKHGNAPIYFRMV